MATVRTGNGIEPEELAELTEYVKAKLRDAFGAKVQLISMSVARTEYERREFSVSDIRFALVKVRPTLKVIR